jgi:hypothetical protein
MNLNKSTLRFSGHDTFNCKEQWILKGLQLIKNEEDTAIFKETEAISKLGVGKNMVRSIHYWLRAFGMLNDAEKITDIAKNLFVEKKWDKYLESEGSLWLLQYFLCKTGYASIFKLIFNDYFSDKATLEFSEFQVLNFINRELSKNGQSRVSENTLISDFKVFIRTYASPTKNIKTIEDDFSVPLLSLNLISDTGRKNDKNQNIYRLNKATQKTISPEIFGFCLTDHFELEKAINYDNIMNTIGSYLCLSNDGLDDMIEKLCDSYKNHFSYKSDAGTRQIQIKNVTKEFKTILLQKHYEIQQ